MPTYHEQCLPAGSVGFRKIENSQYGGACNAQERCKASADHRYSAGDTIMYKKGPNTNSGSVGASIAASSATVQDVVQLRAEFAALVATVNAHTSLFNNLKVAENPKLLQYIPVDHRTEAQQAIAKAIANLPQIKQALPSVDDVAVLFSGNEVAGAEADSQPEAF